jgi:hypothetical protein
VTELKELLIDFYDVCYLYILLLVVRMARFWVTVMASYSLTVAQEASPVVDDLTEVIEYIKADISDILR